MSPVTDKTKKSIAWVVVLTGIGSFMGALDTLVVSTALPTIRLDLGASVSGLEWTVNAYNLSFAVMLITAAALGDRFGRRRLYAFGLVGFAVASAGSALAPSVGFLIFARALQGVAAAFILSLGLALLSAAFPAEKRGTAIGLFSAVTGLAVASGPLVGGAVVNGLDWSWIFWLNVPIGLIAAPLVLTRMRESYGPDSALDLPGLGLISAAAFGIVWGLVRGNSAGWDSLEVIGTLLAGVLLAAAFIAWERRTTDPMIPIGFFRSRAFAAGNLAIFTVLGSLFAEVYFFSQLLQNAMGYDALGAGLRLIPWTATFLVVGPIAGALTDRIGERPLMVSGLLIQAGASVWIALIASTDMAYSQLVIPLVVAGVGISMALPSAQNSVLGSVSEEAVGKAAGTNTVMRELGGVFGIAVAVAVFAAAGSYATPQTFIDGFGPAIGVAAGIALVGAVAGTFLPGHGQQMELIGTATATPALETE
ncbi:MAG TPA: MFS transporter [Solirubrobacterales bacterium]|jgi:EmrB/QacA subfamily drug resistance transporter